MILLCLAALVQNPVEVCPPTGFETATAPYVALDNRDRVFVTFGQGKAIYLAISNDAGKSFSSPRLVAQVDALALGMRRGPRIATDGRTLVITAISGKLGKGKDENLNAWTSTDQGATWSPPARVNDVHASAREGLHGMTFGGGRFVCTWLDLRQPGTTLYESHSADGIKWSKNALVYQSPSGSICECCHPSVAVDEKGKSVFMWRNSLNGDRDMFVQALSTDGRKLGTGSWKLNACPMDGGAVALDGKDRLYSVWRRESTIYACGAGQPESILGGGEQPWLAIGPQGPVYAWLEKRNGKLLVKKPGGEPEVLSQTANDPVLASSPDRKKVVLVWTDPSSPGRIRSVTL